MNPQEWKRKVEEKGKDSPYNMILRKEIEKEEDPEYLEKQREEVEEFLKTGETNWERSSKLSNIILRELIEKGFGIVYYIYWNSTGPHTHGYYFSVKE